MNEAGILRELDKLWKRVEGNFTELEERMQAHEKLHVQEARDRAASRRWLVGTAIAFFMLLVAILALILGQHPA